MELNKISRQEYWLNKGYTKEQIESYLSFERYKSKKSRERRKRNNEKNKKIIEQIKSEIVGKVFDGIKILSINPTTDGQGFWCKMHRTFKDGSAGNFRYFYHFDDYNTKQFLEDIKL